MGGLFDKGATMVLKAKPKRYPWYEVHDAQEGVTCGIMTDLMKAQPTLRYWVAEHTGKSPFALGSFTCACLDLIAATHIAATLNTVPLGT